MEKTPLANNAKPEPKLNSKILPLIEISRTFHAPVEKVFHAWTNAELIKRWYGPYGYSTPNATIDFRVGGKYVVAMKAPDGKVTWSTGIYQEIIPNEKIVTTDQMCDMDGSPISAKEAGMLGDFADELLLTAVFEKMGDGDSRLFLTHQGVSKEMYAECVAGWNGTLDKLQHLVEHN